MKGIKDYVEHWDSWYVAGLFTAVKNHFDMICRQKDVYTEADLERFLTAYQREQLSNTLKKIGSGKYLPTTINEFEKLLEDTCISGIILAIIPYQQNCLLCVTTNCVYAIVIDYSKELDCCTLSIFMNDHRVNGYDVPYIYNVRKTYNVYFDYDNGFYVSIYKTEKEAKEDNLIVYFTAQYDGKNATFERYINGNIDFKMTFHDYSIFSEHAIDSLENCIFQPELDIVSCCFAYSVFCSRSIHFNVLPNEIEGISLYKYTFTGEKTPVMSQIQYHKGELMLMKK